MRFKPFLLFVIGVLLAPMTLHSQTFTLGSGQLTVKHVARNAVRIQYRETLEGQRSKVNPFPTGCMSFKTTYRSVTFR